MPFGIFTCIKAMSKYLEIHMSNPFCRLLSNGYSFSVDRRNNSLQAGPCCLHTKKLAVDSDIVVKHQKEFDSIRDWVSDCNHCHLLESSGQQSLRQTGPDWIDEDVPPQAAVMIDINLDIECNAACVTCSDVSSSLWNRENHKYQGKTYNISRTTATVDTWIKSIIEHVPLDHVRYVKFFGGEPLFTDTHIKFLAHLPNPEQVTIHYTTNGSLFPTDRTLETWSHFKTIIFAASIDGIDEQFDYVRWPLVWSKVSRNLVRLREAGLHNLIFSIEFTANLLNTYYYDRLEQWVQTNLGNNAFGDPTKINVHLCGFNSAFSLDFTPVGVRDLIREKFPPDHVLHRMVSNLRPPSNLKRFKEFTAQWDAHRGQDWQKCFPELVPYLTNK